MYIVRGSCKAALSSAYSLRAASQHSAPNAPAVPKQAILQTAETVVSMINDKPYRKAYNKEDIMEELNNGIVSGKYDGVVADTFLRYYDEIVEKAFQKAQVALTTHQRLLRNYEQVYKNFTK